MTTMIATAYGTLCYVCLERPCECSQLDDDRHEGVLIRDFVGWLNVEDVEMGKGVTRVPKGFGGWLRGIVSADESGDWVALEKPLPVKAGDWVMMAKKQVSIRMSLNRSTVSGGSEYKDGRILTGAPLRDRAIVDQSLT